MAREPKQKKRDNRPLGEYLQNWMVLQPYLLSFTLKELKELFRMEVKVRNRHQIKSRIIQRIKTLQVNELREKIDLEMMKIESTILKKKHGKK